MEPSTVSSASLSEMALSTQDRSIRSSTMIASIYRHPGRVEASCGISGSTRLITIAGRRGEAFTRLRPDPPLKCSDRCPIQQRYRD
jgi:hypothetical protein